MEEENDIKKVGTYQKLQAILSEGKSPDELKLTKKAESNLEDLLGKDEPTFFEKIKNWFKKWDNKLFPKSKMTNIFQKRN